MPGEPGLHHRVSLDSAGQWSKSAEVLAARYAEATKLQREMDLLHLPLVKWPTKECLKGLLHQVIKTCCVDLDIQVRRDASIVIKLVREQAGDENKDWLATGCRQRSAGHVTNGRL